ncbi:endonuclease/exonuclease/phosphatase family protein [Fulvimarina sp. 2208YS6-2-32]|uniref:Endonuclease/exonuclease/phosphatase family protein n=1 Tax=Fulvimarina uroteuthidis TaxID=3098149 RepID=A0ABU5I457_9HYPH|nr:endonuclease/exonuclease/phosphatase family protein [Fulvimarina sp. 2208YS6-2-32]MDY8110176.1 endonuclease/exonuclease/phosphatase family protein [Fulvimarina sp. 2208YS6-2-32]
MKTTATILLSCVLVVLAAASLVPLIETNIWWIRYMDFIRWQLVAVLLFVLVLSLLLAFAGRGIGTGLSMAAVCAGLLGYHAYRLYPYTPLVSVMAPDIAACPADAQVSVMSANVRKGNRDVDAFMAVVDAADPDLLFVMETDEWWDKALAPLADRYPDIIQAIPDGETYYGLHLLSKHELIEPQILRYFGAETPTVQTGARLSNGSVYSFMGLHPRPPQSFDQPTTMRDGHLAEMAFHAENAAAPLIAAGDFNAVSWERIVRRAMRVGNLLDPRIGRGTIPTFDANSALMAWPLDHILFQQPFGLMAFERLADIGSDHYPVMATFCLSPEPGPVQSAPEIEEDDRAELRRTIDAAEAMNP